ncbi:MAG: cyclopropane fatty acyl phospholipid synthase [Gammaproteobacteria bacterium]|nr:cyclopropane fatty acyl phospholipid synthase [Gammaproteobacteria bacterium]
MTGTSKTIVSELLNSVDVCVDGARPWDIQVHNEETYARILKKGALGAGESYMDGWWDCAALDQLFFRVIRADLGARLRKNTMLLLKLALLTVLNRQTKQRAWDVGKKHYDLGNDLFVAMLDSRLVYTCGYWKEAKNLEQAQLNKLKLTCEKLMLEPGMRLLDIGCGWGALAKYAAENYGVSVVGVTISEQQYAYAQKNCAGLPIEIRLQDYRDLTGQFDRVVSLGMFEHVGHLNYPVYMETVHRCLVDEGLFLLHTIGDNVVEASTNEWIDKYIFPNGVLPYITHIGRATEKLFVMEDWHNFGADYDKTLMAWHDNFNSNWKKLEKTGGDRFFRMWNYYLLSSAGAFRARYMQLWQIVFSKKGRVGGYVCQR